MTDDAILIEPAKPEDLEPEALWPLVQDMRKQLRRDAYLAYHEPIPGALGVTWPEVLTV